MTTLPHNSQAGELKKAEKVFVIGLDGATFDLILPWANAGKLPNLNKIMENGVHGPLRSTIPPITPTAWASFRTGKNPGKHGVFDFYKRKANSYERRVTNSADIDGKALWTILSEAGKRVIVFNVPMTYPVEKINGIMISGLLTPGNRPSIYPSNLQEFLKEKVGDYKIAMEDFWCGNIDLWMKELYNTLSKRQELALHLMQEHPWDVFIVVFMCTDWVQHALWKYMDHCESSQVSSREQKYRDAILNLYRRFDHILGKLLERLDEDTIVILISDHGMGPLYKQVHINHWLKTLGLLKFKEKSRLNPLTVDFWLSRIGVTKERLLNWLFALHSNRLLKLFLSFHAKHNVEVSLSDIDWNATKAYTFGHMGQIFINVKGRDPDGIVAPEKDYDKMRTYIAGKLYALEDPETKEKIVDRVFKREELYSGHHLNEAADLLFTLKEGYTTYNGFELDRNSIVSSSDNIQSSVHTLNGIFMITGKGIKKGDVIGNATIMDIVPTILHIMKVPIPSDVDGRVLNEVFEHRSDFANRKVEYQTITEKEDAKQHPWSKKEEEYLKKRLKSLGYIG